MASFVVYANPKFEKFASRWGTVQTIERNYFPDGTPNFKICNIDLITDCKGGANVLYFTQYAPLKGQISCLQEKMEEQIIITTLADTLNVKNLIVIDPYDPLATMERVSTEGTIATANIDAIFWKGLPNLSSGRKILLIIYDHHTLQNRFYYTNGTTEIRFRSGMPLLLKQWMKPNIEKFGEFAIAFPDAGAYKRFYNFFKDDHKAIVCGKQRDGDERRVHIIDGNSKDKNVLIVDDLVRSRGTLIECAKVLRAQGAKRIVCFVTHAQFPNQTWKKFIGKDCPVDEFVTTESIPIVTDTLPVEKFTVLKLRDDINECLALIE